MSARPPADVSVHNRSGINLFALQRKATALVDTTDLVCHEASLISSIKISRSYELPGFPVMHAYLLTFIRPLANTPGQKKYAAFIFQDVATMEQLVPKIKSHLITHRTKMSLQYQCREPVMIQV
jgi:hypothetical protein